MRKLPLRLLQLVTILSACFKSFDLSLRSRRKHEAWGVSPRRAVVKDPKPTKWATAGGLPPVPRARWRPKPDPGFRLRLHPGSGLGRHRARGTGGRPPAVAHFVGFGSFTTALLGLTPQASCFRLLRRLKSKLLKHALRIVTNCSNLRGNLRITYAPASPL